MQADLPVDIGQIEGLPADLRKMESSCLGWMCFRSLLIEFTFRSEHGCI